MGDAGEDGDEGGDRSPRVHQGGEGPRRRPAEEAQRAVNDAILTVVMLETPEAIANADDIAAVDGIDVLFIGSGDLSQSMGFTGQQTHPEVLKVMESGVKAINAAGRIAGCSCPDTHIPKFLDLGVQFFHSTVGRLLQQGSNQYLQAVRKAAQAAGFKTWIELFANRNAPPENPERPTMAAWSPSSRARRPPLAATRPSTASLTRVERASMKWAMA